VSILSWFRRVFGGRERPGKSEREAAGVRTRGRPTSSNGASSMHLVWDLPRGLKIVEASATLEVIDVPAVDKLYFWAFQASFGSTGAGHLGLQWHPGHPGSTAVNWGGYDRGSGKELAGTESPLPSARANVNTRDFLWVPGRAYRLTIAAAGPGEWSGQVDGVEVRRLLCAGERLGGLVVWSEVFADCDDPAVTVRWSDFEAVLADGTRRTPRAVKVSYQAYERGGCTNTTTVADGAAVLQRTGVSRDVAHDTVLPLDQPNG
jgi:hypothetical protein